MSAAAPPLRFAGSALRNYRHVCAFFQSADEEYQCLLPFIRDGLDAGDRGVHVVPGERSDHVQRLRSAGIDVDAAQRSGQLELLRSEQTYLRAGRFDQDRMLELIQNVLDAGHARGYSITRLVAHAECTMQDWQGANDFVQYEARLNYVLPRYPDPVICTYDLTRISAAVAMDVLRTHPLAIIAGVLQENPYFVPPDDLLREVRDRAPPAGGNGAQLR